VQRPAALDAFAYPRFRRVWLAGLVSQLGDRMQIIGRAYLAFELTGKAESVGVIYFATYAPQLIFSLYGGVLADRFDRRRLLIGTQVAEAVGAGALGILAATGHATSPASPSSPSSWAPRSCCRSPPSRRCSPRWCQGKG
jgi:MFS family permease